MRVRSRQPWGESKGTDNTTHLGFDDVAFHCVCGKYAHWEMRLIWQTYLKNNAFHLYRAWQFVKVLSRPWPNLILITAHEKWTLWTSHYRWANRGSARASEDLTEAHSPQGAKPWLGSRSSCSSEASANHVHVFQRQTLRKQLMLVLRTLLNGCPHLEPVSELSNKTNYTWLGAKIL